MTLEAADEFVPKVTKYADFGCPKRLGDSDTLMVEDESILNVGNRSYISFDNGGNWKEFHGFEFDDNHRFSVDPFHKERVFATEASEGGIFMTEDLGRSWREISTPREAGCVEFIDTHPFDKKLLLIDCSSPFDSSSGVYASGDTGASFKCIATSKHCKCSPICRFAASGESSVKDGGIYCIECIEKPERAGLQSENQRKLDIGETFFPQECESTGVLFYTADLGKTKKTFDELSGFSVEYIFVLPSCVAVITSDAGESRSERSKVWISKGGPFKVANLPQGVLPRYVESFPGDNQGRLLLDATVKDNENHGEYTHLFLSDSSGLNFSRWESLPQLAGFDTRLREVENLRGNLQLKLFSKDTVLTKGSFDNGKTWTNLKVVDPSGKHRHLFSCEIDDTAHCSFQPQEGYTDFQRYRPTGIVGSEPTAGIMMEGGIAGGSASLSKEYHMTFISRDGGMSWEVAFECPVYAIFLDFGNIIIVVPLDREAYGRRENAEHVQVHSKFLFSLDQGRTWKEYHFEEPIHAIDVGLNGQGLRAYMTFTIERDVDEVVSYSIDFSNAFDGATCTEDDLERWYLFNGNCIDGVRYYFDRRKPEAKCLMRKTFEKLELHEERDEP